MIRLILVVISFSLFFILSIPIYLIEWIIGKFNPYAKDISCLKIVQAELNIILFLSGVKLEVIGKENIPKDTPVLYVGNHRGFYDVIASYPQCKNVTGYISKKEFEKFPFLSWWMKLLHCKFMDRDDIRQSLNVILDAIKEIKAGNSIFIYPEGTRNKTHDKLLPFKEGSMKIATKGGCPIIPVACTGTPAIFEDHIPFIKGGKITIEYGKAIYPKELNKDEQKFLGAYVQQKVADMLPDNM
ncbi:1-acyl-sn-glycerol-3-phosphate acyltransferase [Acetitomaculum ruminis DSM 5522]|uniref:1-acyl-sn-glycerol-3-phosphate acyltransferase n=1 Tax=Acetitomaculum ruminis DSM 5522 TaxID=1120918 RepID=A0A1I0YB42_9FIRM|nr:lysophospholipid acyltransferase family protein [Acetitomaculum ruminis]SFB10559.1 1-acyl-sn-glycerol-3-phosphate acyltransferase [Acetitomaculum ruminis DSM 5522]